MGYNPDGNITFETWSEYAMDDDGNFYEAKCIEVYESGEKIVGEYNAHDDTIHREIYDAEGNLTDEDVWEYEYNEAGQTVWMKYYRNGVLMNEIPSYAEHSDGDSYWRYPEIYIEYYEDGTKLVVTYGTNTEPKTETLYHADGSAASVKDYVYETFEDGNWKRIQVYENDMLICDTEYVMDAENVWSRKSIMTEYHEDGTKTVYEYDEYENVTKEIHYDANGAEIP